jgi:hypothetical protein
MPNITIQLPILTERQIEAHTRFREVRKALLVRPRRWGATTLAMTVAVDAVIKGRRVGWFDGLPAVGTFDEIAAMLEPVSKYTNADGGMICADTGGTFLFFNADSKTLLRGFDVVIVDNTTHYTDTMRMVMSGDDTRVLALACNDPMCCAERETEFAHLAQI